MLPANRCPACLLTRQLCLCADLPRVETQVAYVIVRHASEQFRSSNSARLAALAMPNCRIIDHAVPPAFAPPSPPAPIDREQAWLLFPEGPPRFEPPVPAVKTVVILDGTWQQARRMRRKLPEVRGLPPLHLPPPMVMPARLRKSPAAGMVSTIEAIAGAVALLEGPSVAAPLYALFSLAVERARQSGRRYLEEPHE